ncbi:MAG TPA: GDP-mannose 4,6-dehydratase [Phycisphaerales bacterium]|nr:GDP-mannose 4,6-dehydratase [Phycisphaerales bacterium]
MPAPSPRPILVTGAAGFIGSHVVQALLRRGDAVLGLDNFDPFYDRARKQANLRLCETEAAAQRTRFDFAEADIRDPAALARLFAEHRPVGLIHLAAKAGVRPSIDDPVAYADVNVTGTAVLLNLAARAALPRAVIASSSSVYGNCPVVPFREDADLWAPISPYAATKKACELLGHAHWHLTAMPTAMLRFFTVYGPRQRPDLAVSLFLHAAAAGAPIAMFGDGASSRDYTYIDDIVAGVLAAYDRIDRFGYRVWNLGGSDPVTLRELIAAVGRVVGRAPEIRPMPPRPGDVERTFADLTRSRAELDFTPAVTLEDGINRQWTWQRQAGP